MSTVNDIMYAAWNKDGNSLKAAVDQEMSARIAQHLDNMSVDVAASMFGATSGQSVEESTPEEQSTQQDMPEEPTNEDI